MIRHTLHDGWTLTPSGLQLPEGVAGRNVPAHVPGSAHLDLLAAGLIPDPYLDRNETELAWAHRAGWRYELTFEAEPPGDDERVDLVFDGLDTVATVELGGRVLGATANMHRSYRFDVRDLLTAGSNDLVVTFRSALEYAEEVERRLGARPHAYTHPFNMVRKMACSFGWDWGPDLQTAGIWKPVRLERWRTARFAQVRPLVTVADDGTGMVEVHVEIERAADTEVKVLVTVADQETGTTVPVGETAAVVTVGVPGARLWWPAGYGEQPLYDLQVSLARGDGEPLDEYRRRVGFRTITVNTEPDEIGTPFTVAVNGMPIFVKGANWIPDDHFLTRITRDRLARRVDQAVGAHMNMLRVWGGGIYETEDFYDVCDERGVLVWQDFPLACASYPEEDPLWGEFEAEARENVARLTPHPSLALWNGGNENLWGFEDWGWQDKLEGRTWGLRYYNELFPKIVTELDPTRFYSAGSPYSVGADARPNDQHHGSRHEWDVWNRVDYTTYRDNIPRFCSEFGFQGPPTWATLTTWIHDDPLTPTSPAFLQHQKAVDGNGKLHRGMMPHLPVPDAFPDWHWATQLNQARAVRFGIEHFRSWWPRTSGALVWQLNDCWPVTSWAVVDGDERPKPVWYGLRQAYAPRLLTFQPRGALVLIAVNDTVAEWTGEVRVERQTFTGAVLDTAKLDLVVPGRSVTRFDLPKPLITPGDARSEVLVATSAEAQATHLFGEDIELAYEPNPLKAEVVQIPGGYRVDVRAVSFARDVAVLADRVAPDAEADDMLVTIPAGRSRSFTVRTALRLADPISALTDPLVLRCANDLCERVDRK
ncbi:glycoside hydrolase family 2 protein [Nonomuraea angiospora]|uniref:glycoside hydrolase family 2 protein n=1 Tax=Nonomuraea angiospora TaxID=46172 RepID=UPI0029AB030C|nr:glycoside hydrolase family 2 protein [Nonomuraea angiospora]MDX3109243.1 glycoside hydrolase family 2 protein [Nonomuraea angiospora]